MVPCMWLLPLIGFHSRLLETRNKIQSSSAYMHAWYVHTYLLSASYLSTRRPRSTVGWGCTRTSGKVRKLAGATKNGSTNHRCAARIRAIHGFQAGSKRNDPEPGNASCHVVCPWFERRRSEHADAQVLPLVATCLPIACVYVGSSAAAAN
jgi:hypothetical protein